MLDESSMMVFFNKLLENDLERRIIHKVIDGDDPDTIIEELLKEGIEDD